MKDVVRRATRIAQVIVPPDWAVTRQRGRWAFIWRYGILKMGLPWGIFMGIAMQWRQHHSLAAWLWGMGYWSTFGAFAFGYLMGRKTWNTYEANYRGQLIRGALQEPGAPASPLPTLESQALPSFLAVGERPATVTIERKAERYCAALLLTILVDGEPAGTLGSAGQPLVLTIDAGEREFRVKRGRSIGPSLTIALAESGSARLVVRSPVTDSDVEALKPHKKGAIKMLIRMLHNGGFIVEVAPGGFEPPFLDPKSSVLPLDEGASSPEV